LQNKHNFDQILFRNLHISNLSAEYVAISRYKAYAKPDIYIIKQIFFSLFLILHFVHTIRQKKVNFVTHFKKFIKNIFKLIFINISNHYSVIL